MPRPLFLGAGCPRASMRPFFVWHGIALRCVDPLYGRSRVLPAERCTSLGIRPRSSLRAGVDTGSAPSRVVLARGGSHPWSDSTSR